MKSTSLQRIKGIDLARALALLGMMAAHFGAPSYFDGTFLSALGTLTHGRSAILFATLAGVSIALMTGRTKVPSADEIVNARMKMVIRALFILAVGSALQNYGSAIDIILPTYALLFVVAIPFLRASRKTLILWSAGFATIGSAVYFLYRPFIYNEWLPIPFLGTFASSNYSPIPWVAVLLAGMAVGRTDLSKIRTVLKLGGIGLVLTFVAYTTSVIAMAATGVFDDTGKSSGYSNSSNVGSGSDLTDDYSDAYYTDGSEEFLNNFTPATKETDQTFLVNGQIASAVDLAGLDCSDMAYTYDNTSERWFSCSDPTGVSYTGNYTDELQEEPAPSILSEIKQSFKQYLIADPHTGSVTEIIGSIGIAFIVIALCVLVCTKFSIVFYPLIALGSMPLTIYSAHVLTHPWIPNDWESFAWKAWLGSVVVGALFAIIWKLFFKRGPLESLMTLVSRKFMTAPAAPDLKTQGELPISETGVHTAESEKL